MERQMNTRETDVRTLDQELQMTKGVITKMKDDLD